MEAVRASTPLSLDREIPDDDPCDDIVVYQQGIFLQSAWSRNWRHRHHKPQEVLRSGLRTKRRGQLRGVSRIVLPPNLKGRAAQKLVAKLIELGFVEA
jgi:hypothetical protein